MASTLITMLRYHNELPKNIDFNMKWFDALLYQLYWWQVEVQGKRDVIDWVITAIAYHSMVFFTALSLFLSKYDYIPELDLMTWCILTYSIALIIPLVSGIYLIKHRRYRKIFTNHEEYDTSWARSIFRTDIISFVFFLSLWWIIPTLMSK